MALAVGELVAFLGLDAGKFDKGISKAEGALKKFGKKGAVIAAGAGAAIGTAAAAGVVGAMNVEAANDKMAASLGLGGKRAEELGEVAAGLYAGAWGSSLEEVNTAVGAVVSSISGMADASGAEIEGVTAKALDFATAFETDVSRAAQVAGQIVSSGLAKDANEAFDLLVASSQKVPAAVREDVIDAADEYSQFFAAMGFSGEEAFGALVAAAEDGAFGIDKTGDAIKEFSIRSTDLSTGTTEAYESIGLSAEKMTGRLLAGGTSARKATGEIVDGLIDIKDPGEQAAAAIALFGTPLEDLNVTEIPAFLDQLDSMDSTLGDVSGAAEEMGATLNDNAATNLESFTRQAQQGFVNVIGGQLIPFVNQAAAALASGFGPAMDEAGRIMSAHVVPALKKVGTWLTTTESGADTLQGSVSVLGTVLAAMAIKATVAAVRAAAAWTMAQIAAIRSAAVQTAAAVRTGVAWTAMAARAVAAWALMGVQAMIQAARMAAAWFIALGPIGWAIAAIIAIAAIVIANWDTIVRWTKKAWNWVKEKTIGGAKKILNWLKGNWPTILAVLTGPIGIAVLMIVRNWDKIKAAATSVKNFVVNAFKSFVARVRSNISRMVSFVRSISRKVKNIFTGANKWLLDAGKKIVQGLIDGIKRMAGKAGEAAKDVTRKIKNMLPGSPVKEGPLTVLNRGYAGGEIVRMLADGMRREQATLAGAMMDTTGNAVLVAAPSVPGVPRHGDVEVKVGFSQKDIAGIAEVVVQQGEKKTQRLVRMGGI